MKEDYSYLRWHRLSSWTRGDELIELLAATCIDGIGCIARWEKADGIGWNVSAMDTESESGMQAINYFDEDECIPSEPPTIFDDK